MLRKVRRLPVMVRLMLIIVCLGSLSGCGDSADPLGIGIVQFYDVSTGTVITSVSVDPGGSLTLVVRVMSLRSDGSLAPVIGERVTFTLLTPANNGGLAVVNDRTAGNGQAMALYTAGNNFAIDSVRVTTGAGATATITINKTGGIIGPRISNLTASSTSVADGQTSIITATVTDGNNNPMMGEAVTFTIPTNDSNACFINAANACVLSVIVTTDGSGNARAVYRGGSNSPNFDVFDTVRAALANGSTNFVVITRSAATVTSVYSITVSATPATLSAVGGSSVITATVRNNLGTAVSGVTVTFTQTGGVSILPASSITDASGNAVSTFTGAGVATGTAGVATASITVNGTTYTASVVITNP
ncbi:MAG: Ig-like domain-containing protein [Thermodesulfobacteriota bacterium]